MSVTCTNVVRNILSPRFVIFPYLTVSFDSYTLGTNPAYAAKKADNNKYSLSPRLRKKTVIGSQSIFLLLVDRSELGTGSIVHPLRIAVSK